MRTTYAVTPMLGGDGVCIVMVDYSQYLSENDSRPEYNLGCKWGYIRRIARRAMIDYLAEREQTTSETLEQARARIAATCKLIVHSTNVTPTNLHGGVTFREVAR